MYDLYNEFGDITDYVGSSYMDTIGGKQVRIWLLEVDSEPQSDRGLSRIITCEYEFLSESKIRINKPPSGQTPTNNRQFGAAQGERSVGESPFMKEDAARPTNNLGRFRLVTINTAHLFGESGTVYKKLAVSASGAD